jgi:hypothetical protein
VCTVLRPGAIPSPTAGVLDIFVVLMSVVGPAARWRRTCRLPARAHDLSPRPAPALH